MRSFMCVTHSARDAEQGRDYARSFQFLERGKRRKRASLDYSVEDDLALFEADAAGLFSGAACVADGRLRHERADLHRWPAAHGDDASRANPARVIRTCTRPAS